MRFFRPTFRRVLGLIAVGIVVAAVMVGIIWPPAHSATANDWVWIVTAIVFALLVVMIRGARPGTLVQRRLARGRCGACAYLRDGLADTAPCPECGKAPGAYCPLCAGDWSKGRPGHCINCGWVHASATNKAAGGPGTPGV